MNDGRHKAFREDSQYSVDELIFWLRSRQLFPFIKEGEGVVADFGSGFDVTFLRRLLKKRGGLRGIAVDLSLDPKLASDRLSLVVADLNKPLPLPDQSIDTATSLAVLEHLEQPEVQVCELYRVLKSGGTLLLTTPTPAAKPVLELISYRLHLIDAAEIRDHKHYFNEAELRALFAKAGFVPEQIRYKPFLFGLNQLVIATKL